MKKFVTFFLIFTLLSSTIYVSAAQQTTEWENEQLTIEQATEYAISYSRTLKNLEESTLLAHQDSDDLRTKMLEATTPTTIDNVYIQIKNNEFLLLANRANTAIEKENIKWLVAGYFRDVILAEQELKLYDISLDIEREELSITKLKASMGRVSQIDLDIALLNYDKNVSGRSTKTEAVELAYKSLNNIMNKPITNRYDLVLEAEYNPIEEVSLKQIINRELSNNQKIKELAHEVTMAQHNVDNYSEYYSSKTYEAYDADFGKATRSLADEKRSLEQNIADEYNNIISLEQKYNESLETLINLQKQYEINLVKYELGKITELTLKKSEYEILKLKNDIYSIICNHWIELGQFSGY